MLSPYKQCIYNGYTAFDIRYILVITIPGFRLQRRDHAGEPPQARPQSDDEADPRDQPDPNDEELLHARPDQKEMEAAIEDFNSRMQGQQQQGYTQLHNILARLPNPKKVSKRAITVTEAIEGGVLPRSGSEDATLFTPSEVLLYKHAQDMR